MILVNNVPVAVVRRAKQRADISDDGIASFTYKGQPYRVWWEWWGPGCVFEHELKRYEMSDAEAETAWEWMGMEDKVEVMDRTWRRRLGGVYPGDLVFLEFEERGDGPRYAYDILQWLIWKV